ncbi:MAG: type II/IV secretion system protein [Leptolyngbya sp. PLA3]|nr:MAG: type II/IV secretion system protein [Cyanobacteria bacterium CYA]MCE7967717.1 type II/IV secretion system protein [Leptolyngbya sp. PL-A3]
MAGKINIDDILSQLGAQEGDPSPARRAKTGKVERKHALDEAETSFSPVPAMPSGQRRFGQSEAPKQPDGHEGVKAEMVFDPGPGQDATGQSLSELLLARGVITREQLSGAEQILKQTPGRCLAELLIDRGADEEAVQRGVAELAGVPFERVDLKAGLEGGFDGKLLQRLGPDFCKEHSVLPLRSEGSRVVIGATSPDDVFMLDAIRARLGVSGIKLVLITSMDLRAALEVLGGEPAEEVDLSEILSDVEEGDVEVSAAESSADAVDLEAKAGESPVIRYANYIIQTAVKEGASDIHVEPGDKRLKVRFRIDGILFEMMNPPSSMSAALTSRLKIMANLDISERRVPQDGRIRCTVQGRKLDLRVSTIPSTYGEKTVMRILDTRSINVDLENLGFSEHALQIWKNAINEPHGIVLVTGPTGSGKTTTLYASLRQLDKAKLNISTVEDPVEYHLDGITQTQTHEKIGMTFAKALKALLRQDPDVIMLGEIRDHETAHTAVQAALTGHLVLSTLHTNDAPSSVTRLVNIGLEPFLVGAALNAVLAQRLVRRLCQACKSEENPTEEMAEYLEMQGLPINKMWSPKGCEKCRGTGHSGRVGIYELLTMDDSVRDVIARNPNVTEFRRLCIERGMVTLRQDGMHKAVEGRTTVQEVLRVTDSTH